MEFSLLNKQFTLVDAFRDLIKLKDYGRFVGIDMDRNGRIWLATQPKGILIYDPGTKEVTPLFSDSATREKTGQKNMQIYCDRDGIVWATFWDTRGIYELIPYKPSVTLYPAQPGIPGALDDPIIASVMPAGKDQLWIGTLHGLNIMNVKTGRFDVWRQKDVPGITGNTILPFSIDTIHRLAWITNEHADTIFEMDMDTRKCTPVKFRDSNKLVNGISVESEFTQLFRDGLLLYDANHGFFELKAGSLTADMVIPFTGYIGRIELIANRFLFLKNPNYPPNYSFEFRNGKWVKTNHFFDSLDWSCLYIDKKDQTIWMDLSDEIAHLDKDFRKIRSYPYGAGNDKTIFSMRTDNAGNLWFVVTHGINRLDIRSGIINTISAADGYPSQFFFWVTPTATYQGDIYFAENPLGTGKIGLIRIDPEKYISSSPSITYFNSVTVKKESYPSPLGVNALTELSLAYNRNDISIETGVIDYYSMGKSYIRYKLERKDGTEDWQYSPAYYTIRYEGLEPGNYKLILQASNASNEFNCRRKCY